MIDSDLFLQRNIFTDRSTIGDLKMDGVFMCNTLEDTIRNRDKNNDGILQTGEKIYGETAIPAGRYEIKMCPSFHFQRKMPHLHNEHVCCAGEEVSGVKYIFKDVMIHWGNKPADVKGCIATGTKEGLITDWVSSSQKAYNDLEPKILSALNAGRLFIFISGGYIA